MADDFDFSAASAQAKEYFASQQNSDSGSAPVSGGTSTPGGDSTNTPTPAPAPTGVQSAPPTTPTGSVVEVDFGDGRVEKLTPQQIRDGFLRQQDYTKKTQEVAAARRQAEQVLAQSQQFEQEKQQIKELLSNPQALMYLAQQHLAAQQPGFDPNAPASLGQAAQLAEMQSAQLAAQLQQMEHEVQQVKQDVRMAAAEEVKERLEVARYTEQINGTLSKAFEKNPILKALPETEDVIRFRVAQLKPQTIEETVQAFERVSEEVAKAQIEHFDSLNKQQAIAKQKLVHGGIEPPGGAAAPAPGPTSFRDAATNTVDWKRLAASAAAYMEANRK